MGPTSRLLIRASGPALLTLIWVEVLRVWLPSLVFTVADGRFSATSLFVVGGTMAAVTSAVGLVAVGRTRSRHVLALGAILLAVSRVLLAVGPLGGTRQLLVASIGATGGMLALIGIVADGRVAREDRLSVGAGLLGASLLHAATGTIGLVWPQTTTAMVLGVVLAIAMLAGVVGWMRDRARRIHEDPLPAPSAAWPWWTLLPALLLVLSLSAVPGRVATADGWGTVPVAVAVAAMHVLAGVAVLLPTRWPRLRAVGVVVVALPVGTIAALGTDGVSSVLGQAAIAICVALLLGAPDPRATGAAPRTRAAVAGLAITATVLLGSLTTLATQVALPVDRRVTALTAALVGAALAVRIVREPRVTTAQRTAPLAGVLVALVLGAAMVGAVGARASMLPETPSVARVSDPSEVPTIRVGLYNIRHGFDLHGRFAAPEQAALLRDLDLDVLVLNDVDRGWLSTGGHDALGVIRRELGLSALVFGASTDEVHGNAVLTRLPLIESAADQLPAGADPRPRGLLAAVVEWPNDARLGIVGTHLTEGPDRTGTRIPQARAVAGTVGLLRERQVPTVLLGDLGAGPGTTELSSFETLLEDALPAGIATYPADDPQLHLDHILISPELRRRETTLPATPWSDHLPIVVTLELVESP
ncbi:MAG: endonuclease/exonuclease/phosphatase family protein [Nitriliruptoraceae bacterium]|nr:endonuclease/exonuclease/phosphatase family protein [Nitriliruptoraceae bacterium]